ncbi:MAG: hypothetical protein LBS07_04380, partial [Prevotellaceae bacterium]|nr:hypothetical protein [Prevotellaceae bacterium]
MRKTIRILLLLSLLSLPFSSYAQNQKIKFSGNTITVQAAFEQIEKQAGLSVAYDSKIIDIKKLISPLPAEATLSELMTLL